MAEISLPVIITAVADSDMEGFISGTLFSQGWSVIYRALDTTSLLTHLDQIKTNTNEIVLIYSPDLPGVTPAVIAELQSKVKQVIGFSTDARLSEEFPAVLPRPEDATALISLVRGFVRTPLLRSQTLTRDIKRRAKVIAIASPGGSSGCTTISINLAMELSVLDHDTLLLDADLRRPAVAPLLSLHGLDVDTVPRMIATKLHVSEFGRANVEDLNSYMDKLLERYDNIVIDLGSIEGLEDSLTDRRWTSSLIHWSCDNSDELWLVGKADLLGIVRMEKFIRNFAQTNIRAKLCLLLNMRAVGRKGADQERLFLSSSENLKPLRIFTLPKDVLALTRAEAARSALMEVNARSAIRKAIVKLAVEVAS